MFHDLWVGLGIVGVWAALDAFGEARGLSGGGLYPRFQTRVTPRQIVILRELDDLRNLLAHNIAGVASGEFFLKKNRRLLQVGTAPTFTCGCRFSGVEGDRIVLTLEQFLYYVGQAEEILSALR